MSILLEVWLISTARKTAENYILNCFNFYRDSVNDDGEEDTEEVNIDFSLDNKKFARAYYRDELIANNVDADYDYRWDTVGEIELHQNITKRKINRIVG